MTLLKTKPVQLLLSAILVSISSVALAQSVTRSVAQSDAQKTFDQMKTLTGNWQGKLTTTPADAMKDADGMVLQISLRTTSSGNAIMHEVTAGGMKDDPITMLYLDGDRLLLTHYCDAGNRPRMVAKASPDGKTVEFDFLDLAGPTEHGHMDHAVFTFIDANHHTEDWTYMLPGDKPMLAHFNLERTK
jgi:hypothetical protein